MTLVVQGTVVGIFTAACLKKVICTEAKDAISKVTSLLFVHCSFDVQTTRTLVFPTIDDDTESRTSTCSSTLAPSSEEEETSALVKEVQDLLDAGNVRFELVADCAGGTYFVVNAETGARVAVFKPADEEPGMETNPKGGEMPKAGFVAGQSHLREVAAFRLDRGLAGVPETVMFSAPSNLLGREGETRVRGSLQRFVAAEGEAWDSLPARFSENNVRRVALLDLATLNCDRHGGNLLVKEDGTLVPIDHGFVLPSTAQDLDWEWKFWPQAKTGFDAEEQEWVANLPAAEELESQYMSQGIDEVSATLSTAATVALKVGVKMGFTARQLAEFWQRSSQDEASPLERLVNDLPKTGESRWSDFEFAAMSALDSFRN
eukprot:Hpha_TRINITY_DN16799_c1_g2::TRINITY_DN16799_c1_g2_i2::g.80624::m.80624